jgi:cytochrome P450 family 135
MPAAPPAVRSPALVQWLRYGLTPEAFLLRAQRRHGDTYVVRLFGQRWTVLGHPDAVREVFTGSPDELYSGEANETIAGIIGRRNVLILDGPEHLARRRIVLPPFHGDHLRSYEDVVRGVAAAQLADWPVGRTIPVLDRMRDITFEVILRAVFGVEDRPRLQRLGTTLADLLTWTVDPRRIFVFGVLGPERLERSRGFRRQLAAVDREVHAHIAERRADPRLDERTDVLSLLLRARHEDGTALDDVDIRDELVTLLVAGHETTAALLAWAIHDAVRAPGVMDRLAAREDGFAAAVVAESLRLRPPVPLVVRRLKAPQRIAGYDLPAGATVAPCGMLVHRRPELYPDPQAFRPERFLDAKPSTYGWLPFGGGVRRCIGAAFAQTEARIVLEELAAAYELAPGGRRPERTGRRGIVLVPGRGGRVSVVARRPGAAAVSRSPAPAAAAAAAAGSGSPARPDPGP